MRNVVEDRDGWATVANQPHFKDPHIEVATVEVRSPARHVPHRWTVVHRKAAVVIAPLTAEGKLILVKQERIPIRAAIWEMPAGQIDGEWPLDSSEIEEVALREMREEIGYELAPGGELIPLGYFFSSAGFTDEHAYLFLARTVQPAAGGAEHDESESIIESRGFSADELKRMIATNEICDANTLAVYARLVARGLIDGGI